MYAKIGVNFLLALIIIVAATFFLNSFGLLKASENIVGDSPAVKMIAGSIFGLLVTFFVFERWKRIESGLEELRKNQNAVVKEIQDAAKERVNTYLDDKSRKIEALLSRVDRLTDEHPWLAAITENDLIPNVPSCKIILRTSIDFFNKGKHSLLYEYLYGYLKQDDEKNKINLEGTLDDFLDLAEFCEQKLNDEHLGILALRSAYERTNLSFAVAPHYIRRLIRTNQVDNANTIAKKLRKYIFPTWWQVISLSFSKKSVAIQPRYTIHCLIALSLTETAIGNTRSAKYFMSGAEGEGRKIHAYNQVVIGRAEAAVLMGDFDSAIKFLDIAKEPDFSLLEYYEVARIYAILGYIDKSNYFFEAIKKRVVKLDEKMMDKSTQSSKKSKRETGPNKENVISDDVVDDLKSERVNDISRSSNDLIRKR